MVLCMGHDNFLCMFQFLVYEASTPVSHFSISMDRKDHQTFEGRQTGIQKKTNVRESRDNADGRIKS